MPTITVAAAREAGSKFEFSEGQPAKRILEASKKAASDTVAYEVFLSHAFADAKIILGVKRIIESLGHTVYVDWIDDPQLDREVVDAKTAQLLRRRMSQSGCLLYATTQGAKSSRWMPWECGYFDGLKGRTAILPLTDTPKNEYEGQEYLALYPYVQLAPRDRDNVDALWIHTGPSRYVSLMEWLDGKPLRDH